MTNRTRLRPARGSALLLTLLLLSALSLLTLLGFKLTSTHLLISANLGASVVALAENETTHQLAIRRLQQALRQPQRFDWRTSAGLYDRRRTAPLPRTKLTDETFWNDANSIQAGSHSRYLVEYLGRIVLQTAGTGHTKPGLQALDLFLVTSRTSKPGGALALSQLLYAQKPQRAYDTKKTHGSAIQRIQIPTGIIGWTDL